jgi:hypothetical protein
LQPVVPDLDTPLCHAVESFRWATNHAEKHPAGVCIMLNKWAAKTTYSC